MKKFLVFSLICIMVSSLSGICSAQEEEGVTTPPATTAAPAPATEYSYGTVTAINKDTNEIAISEYNWETDAETSVTYSVATDVLVENAPSWQEIPAGTYVDIEYTIGQDGKRTATYIGIYEEEPAEE